MKNSDIIMTIGRKILLLILILLPVSLLAIFDFLQWEGIFSVNKTVGTVIVFYGFIFLLATTFAWLIVREVTLRKKTEASLRETEDSALLLIDNIKDYALMRLDATGKVVSWNSGAEHIKGYKAAEVIGKSFEIFYTPEDVERGIPAENLRMTKLKGHYETEGWRLKKDGSRFWANAAFTSLLDKNGNHQGFAKITRDITDRKQTEEKLHVLSRQIEQSGDAIYIVDTDRIIRSWNKGAEKLYGYTAKEAIGAEANILLQTNLSEKEIEAAVKSLKEKDYWSGELKRKNKAGKDIFVRSSNSTIKDESGVITAYVAVNIDMTEEVKLREQVNYLATLVDQSTDAIVSIDLNENIRSWNKGAEQLYGYTAGEVLGKNAISFGIIRLTPGETKKIFSEILNKGSWQSEMNLYHKNGSGFFGAINASLVKDEKGKTISIVFDVKDISIRKQLEDELKKHNTELEEKIKERTTDIYKSEKRFRALIENNYDMIALLDESANILYRSPSATRITGWTDEEMRRNPATQNIHPDDVEAVSARIKTLIGNPGASVNTLFRSLHKKGYYIWLEGITINLLHDEDVKALVFNFRDVTERIEADARITQTLRELSDYKIALDESSIVAITNQKGIITYVNDNFCKISKYSRKELIGHDHRIINSGFHPKEFIRDLWVTIANGKIWRGELRNRAKDGTIYWVDTTIVPFLDESKKPFQYVAIRADITMRREAEENLINAYKENEIVLNRISDGVVSVDNQWRYTYLNNAAMQTHPLKREEIIGKVIWDVHPGMKGTIFWDKYHEAMETGNVVEIEDYYEPMNMWFTVKVYPSPDGLTIYYKDFTARKRVEQQIQEINAELEVRVAQRTQELKKVNEELEAFSYSVSHDLRAPLRAIIGFTAILEEEYSSKLDDEARRITGIIKGSTLKMGNLIDDLLAFSRMSRQDIEKILIDTNELVHQIITEQEKKNTSANIQWIIHPLHNTMGDISAIRQVWINLVANAIKYSGSKPGQRIEIGSSSDDKQTTFFIKDNGVGFDQQYSDKLFKVFQRLHSSTEFEGTGVGLAIVEKIISKHGGKVWAEAEVDKGASFYFSLPNN